MNKTKDNEKLFKFFSYLLLCLLLLSLFKIVYETSDYTKKVTNESIIIKKQIYENDKNYNINIFYPKVKNVKVNNIINEYITNYKNDFIKRSKNNKNAFLKIDYSLTFIKDYLIVYFNIKDNTNQKRINKSIIIDTNENKETSIKNFIKNEKEFELIIKDKVTKKYANDISKEILKLNINDYDINIKDNYFYVTFNDLEINLNYVPTINFKIRDIIELDDIAVFNEVENNDIKQKKYIALTFDDGPNKKTTNAIIDTLSLNDSKATFFVLGNRIKYNKEVILRQKAIGNEIGSHTYSHKNLTKANLNEYNEELNSTNILFNEITSDYIKLLRPPYGAVNSFVKENSPYPLILWDIDTLDWMSLNAKKVSDHVLKNVKDGDIVLMHDIYESTAEAVKIMVPELKERGFELVTVSQLAEIKNIKLEKGKVYRKFN